MVVSREHESKGIYTVRSRYLATSESVTDWEDLECAVVICKSVYISGDVIIISSYES
jgi:hypothetical protein